MSFLSLGSKMTIYPARKAQVALLLTKKVTVLAKYLDFADVFLKKLAEILPEYTGINNYAIKPEDGKQSSYGPIYSPSLVELKILKIYIKINLVNGFIRSLKSPVGAPILFICKPNGKL